MLDVLKTWVDLFIHVDRHLIDLAGQYGSLTYVILFGIIFCETGLVVTPLLPGDSLLFAAGALCASLPFNVVGLWLLLWCAAVLGDNLNYMIGRKVGPKVFSAEKNRYFRRSHLDKTHAYFERYGAKTLVIARFVPIVRTFAPFVAGVGRMSYRRFLMFSILGGGLWISLFVFAGYYFGGLPFVKSNFKLVILAVIAISIAPMMIELWRHRKGETAAAS